MYKALNIISSVIISMALVATTRQAPAAENGFSKMVGSFNASIKSGFSKISGAISPKSPQTNFSDAISLHTKARPSAKLYVTVAKTYVSNGNLQDAEDMYKRALKISPKYANALTGYAQLKDKMGSYGEAVAMYEKAAKAHPQDATVFNGMGLCHATHGNFERALAALQRAVKLQPRELKYRNNIAMVLVEMGRYDAAFAHFKTQYDDSVAHYNLAYLIQKRGDKPRAIEHFAAAIEKNPNLSEARVWHDHLAGTQTPDMQAPKQQAHNRQAPPPQMSAAPQSVQQQPRGVVEGRSLAAQQPRFRAESLEPPINRPRVWLPRQQAPPTQRSLTQRPLAAQREATAKEQLNASGSATAALQTPPAPGKTESPAPGKTESRSMAFRTKPGNTFPENTARAPRQSSMDRLPPIEQLFQRTSPTARQLKAPPVPLPAEPAAERIVGFGATPPQEQAQAPRPTVPLAPTPQVPVRTAKQFKSPARPSHPWRYQRAAPLPGHSVPAAPPASGTTRAPMVYPLPPVDDYRY